MANGEEVPRPKLISGGSLREAELPVAGIALPAQAARSESPFVQGLRRLRKSTTIHKPTGKNVTLNPM